MGIIENQKSDGLMCTIPKCIPISVSGLMAAQGSANFDQFHFLFDFTFFYRENTKRGKVSASLVDICFRAARTPDGFRQFPRNFGNQPGKHLGPNI